jgi:lipopolysaccharide export system permease protein
MRTNFPPSWRPLKFDRYILEETVGTFVGTCIFILFILLMFQALRLAEFFIIHGASGFMLGQMAFFMALSFLPTALPLAFLITVLIAFGRLSSDSELIAMKANGLSLTRLAAPILVFASIIVSLSIVLNNEWVPWGESAFKKTQIKIGNTRAVAAIKEGTFTSGFFDLLLFADKVDADTNRLHHVFIFDEREAKNPLAYVAKEAQIVPVKSPTELGAAIMLRLYNGGMHHNNLETHTYEKMDFDAYHLYLKVDEGGDTAIVKPHMIPQGELVEKIKNTSVENYDGREYRGEYWRRYATALSPLIFVFLGIGFGTFRYRTAKSGAILTGFIILIVYWSLQTAGTVAVQRGQLSPFFAMQLPNMVMLIAGIFGFRRASW